MFIELLKNTSIPVKVQHI